MPIPVSYTPVQPTPSIVAKPVIWVPNIWQGVICPTTPPTPEVWSVTVTNFQPIICPVVYNGDPGIVLSLTPGTATSGGAGVITTGPLVGTVTATLNATGTYTDYLFPNKEYKYRNDIAGGVLPIHTPNLLTGPSGYTATYGTLNQGNAAIRSTLINPAGGIPTAGTPTVGMIEQIPGGHNHMQEYTPDPNYMIIVQYTVVVTSSCGVGAGTFPIRQIVYDDKDIAAQRFSQRVNSQTGRISDELITELLGGT